MTLARFKVVIAYDIRGGIALKGDLPWNYPEDLKFFRTTTSGHNVLMGRKTFEALPEKYRPLPNRRNIIISKSLTEPPNGTELADSITKALELCSNQSDDKETFIIGGGDIFNQVIKNYLYLCDGIYSTEIQKDFNCDTFLNHVDLQSKCDYQSIQFEDEKDIKDYRRVLYTPKSQYKIHGESEYINMMQNILDNGLDRGDRTGVGTRSIFGVRMEFDISETVPIITTKKVFWKKVVGELLWFISGSTSVADLHKHNIHFWDANSSREFLDKRGLNEYEEGDLGPVYGFQWRHWGAKYQGHKHDYTGEGEDQIAEIVRLLKEDPFSRRILLSAWNVGELSKMALPPCHLLVQFYVREDKDGKKYLDCQLYQRSGDMFLGVPFNITCYSILVYMLCDVVPDLYPGRFIHTIGDAHIYLNHMDAVKKQLSNTPRPFPTLKIKKQDGTPNIDGFSLDDFTLENYDCCAYIRAPMAV